MPRKKKHGDPGKRKAGNKGEGGRRKAEGITTSTGKASGTRAQSPVPGRKRDWGLGTRTPQVLRPYVKKSAFSSLHKAHFAANFRKIEAGRALSPCFQGPNAFPKLARSRNYWASGKTPCASDQAGRARTRAAPRKNQKIAASRPLVPRPQPKTWHRLPSQEERPSAGSENNRPLLVSGQRVKTNFWPLSNTCLTQIGPR